MNDKDTKLKGKNSENPEKEILGFLKVDLLKLCTSARVR